MENQKWTIAKSKNKDFDLEVTKKNGKMICHIPKQTIKK